MQCVKKPDLKGLQNIEGSEYYIATAKYGSLFLKMKVIFYSYPLKMKFYLKVATLSYLWLLLHYHSSIKLC